MHYSTSSISSEDVWQRVGDEGENAELVLDCCLLDFGRAWDCVGVFAEGAEGAHGWCGIALPLTNIQYLKYKHDTLQKEKLVRMRMRLALTLSIR